MTNEELDKIIRVRASPDLPGVDPLFWPNYDRGYQEIMHEHSDTVYKYTP